MRPRGYKSQRNHCVKCALGVTSRKLICCCCCRCCRCCRYHHHHPSSSSSSSSSIIIHQLSFIVRHSSFILQDSPFVIQHQIDWGAGAVFRGSPKAPVKLTGVPGRCQLEGPSQIDWGTWAVFRGCPKAPVKLTAMPGRCYPAPPYTLPDPTLQLYPALPCPALTLYRKKAVNPKML